MGYWLVLRVIGEEGVLWASFLLMHLVLLGDFDPVAVLVYHFQGTNVEHYSLRN